MDFGDLQEEVDSVEILKRLSEKLKTSDGERLLRIFCAITG